MVAWDDRPVNLARIAWLVTVGVALVTALLLLVSGYQGYAAVAVAVGASAAINLL
jgi:hypothetical protein